MVKSNQLKIGIRVEAEHKPTYRFLKTYIKKYDRLPSQKVFYKHIAQNHLTENKKYYTKLIRAKL